MNKEPITVCIPVYNAGKYIGRCLDSILRQSFPHFILKIYDDGSTDNSMDIVRAFNDKRIQVIDGKANKGPAIARTRLIESLDTELCAWIDPDDVFCRTDFLARSTELYSFTGCDLINFANTLERQPGGKEEYHRATGESYVYRRSDLFSRCWPTDNHYLFWSKCMTSELAGKSVPYDIGEERYCADDMFFSAMWWFHARAYMQRVDDSPYVCRTGSIGFWESHNGDISHGRFLDMCRLQHAMANSLYRRMRAVRPLSQADKEALMRGVNLRMSGGLVRAAKDAFGDEEHAKRLEHWKTLFCADGRHPVNDIPDIEIPGLAGALLKLVEGR